VPIRSGIVGAAVAFFIATANYAAHAAETTIPQSVLILAAYRYPLPANVAAKDTLRRVVPEALGRPVLIFSEFLNIEFSDDANYAQTMAATLRHKHERQNIGVIVTFGSEPLKFLLRNRELIFPKAPVVYGGIARETLREIQVPSDVIGWTVDLDPTPTLVLASRLHPQATQLVFVSGASPLDRSWERILREADARLPMHMRTEFLTGLPTVEVLRQLRALSPDAIVFTPGYYADGSGRAFTPRESTAEMASVSGAPIFGQFDTFLGSGIVGGYMVTFEDQANRAAELVAALLSGTAPAAIRTGSIPNVFMAD